MTSTSTHVLRLRDMLAAGYRLRSSTSTTSMQENTINLSAETAPNWCVICASPSPSTCTSPAVPKAIVDLCPDLLHTCLCSLHSPAVDHECVSVFFVHHGLPCEQPAWSQGDVDNAAQAGAPPVRVASAQMGAQQTASATPTNSVMPPRGRAHPSNSG